MTDIKILKQKNKNIYNYEDYGFDKMPYLDDKYKDKWFVLVLAQERVKNVLKRYSDFGYVTFTDVGAGIQMSIRNKKCCLYIAESIIKYDFSNIDETIDEVIENFIESDNQSTIQRTNNFYEQGMKYGWN